MSNEYRDKHLLDVSNNQEPDYQARFDKPIVVPCYEEYLDTQLVDQGYKEIDDYIESGRIPF